jgi:hypothetical protein
MHLRRPYAVGEREKNLSRESFVFSEKDFTKFWIICMYEREWHTGKVKDLDLREMDGGDRHARRAPALLQISLLHFP